MRFSWYQRFRLEEDIVPAQAFEDAIFRNGDYQLAVSKWMLFCKYVINIIDYQGQHLSKQSAVTDEQDITVLSLLAVGQIPDER